jgi:hypothetical protein
MPAAKNLVPSQPLPGLGPSQIHFKNNDHDSTLQTYQEVLNAYY